MSRPNPLIPKSSLLEQKAKSRSGLQMVMIIVAVHMVFLGGLLFSGCRPDQSKTSTAVETNTIPVLPQVAGEIASPLPSRPLRFAPVGRRSVAALFALILSLSFSLGTYATDASPSMTTK